jgi:alpha-galactosidase
MKQRALAPVFSETLSNALSHRERQAADGPPCQCVGRAGTPVHAAITQRAVYKIVCAAVLSLTPFLVSGQPANLETMREIRTPKPPPTPRINGPAVFGVRPEHPLLYHIPATGDRPMEFAVKGLPDGLKLDSKTGDLTGLLKQTGDYLLLVQAKNAKGSAERRFKIVVGETIALTPPMGWNSWNHYASRVTGDIVLANAKAMANSGLINHGWTYLNIDDTWQGKRGGPLNAIQGNEKFPDMKGLCDAVHALGLKIGIYSTPWTTSYADHIGGSAENPEGTWTPPTLPKKGNVNKKILPWAIGKYSFAKNDANQWAAWGMDYLKYDWNPNELPETQEMYDALRHSGRDIILSLSNSSPFKNAPALSKLANCWRTSGDIKANWKSMSSKGFGEDKWLPFAGPGHWNDPDMLEIGTRERNQPGLTPDEEYTHMTLWCLVSAPLLLGNDLSQLDAFTLNVLENDEVLAVNQDALGRQASNISADGELRVLAKDLADGSKAVGLFNTGSNVTATVTVKWSELNISGPRLVRDLWRQKDLGQFSGEFSMPVAPHSAEMVKIGK